MKLSFVHQSILNIEPIFFAMLYNSSVEQFQASEIPSLDKRRRLCDISYVT